MADGKISSMVVATETKTTDLFEISQQVGGVGSERVTRANDLQSIAVFLHDVMQNSALTSTDKTLVGAINELAKLRTFNSGDTISFGSGQAVFAGYVTNAGKNIVFYVPLSKPPKGVSGAIITGQIAARSGQGILNGGALNLADFSVSSSITSYGIQVTVQSDTAFTNVSTNNTISVSPSTGGLRIELA